MSTTIAVKTQVEVTDNLLSGIICTAVEGGIGYWSQVDDYHWHDPVLDGMPHWAEVTVHEMDEDEEEGYKPVGVHINMHAIAEALRKIADPEVEIEYATNGWRFRMIQAMMEDEGGDIDAGDADNIVQIAMFGKLVYG